MSIDGPWSHPLPVDGGFIGWFRRSSTWRQIWSIDETHRRAVAWSTGRQLAIAWQCWAQMLVAFFRSLCGSYMESYPDVYTSNMFIFKFSTYNMIFIVNEHIKSDETYFGTKGHFKENLSNIMDILGRLTSKLHKTWRTFFKNHINSFKNHISTFITHKHIKPHMRHLVT